MPRIPGLPAAVWALLAALVPLSGARAGTGRGTTLADFDTGSVSLSSYDPAEDLNPNSWQLTQNNAYGGSGWSLRLYGNTWKAQAITPVAITQASVFRAALYAETKGEMQAIGFSDGTNTLFYTVAGTEVATTLPWEVAYQGAFSLQAWHLYLLPVGRDWYLRYGYVPTLTRLVYVNDRDTATQGATLFDEIEDVTADQPTAPQVEIVQGRQSLVAVEKNLYRMGVQFHAQVDDPDGGAFTYAWDFGDSTTSSVADPVHDFLIPADYTFTVTLGVRDDTGLWGRDSVQVRVDPGGSSAPMSINFVGDVMMGRNYDTSGGMIDTYGPQHMFIPTRPIFGDDAEVNVCNLEVSLTDQGTPHPTKSIVFRGRPANVAGLTYAGVDLVSMANNHVIDYGQVGMDQTEQVLDANGIRRSGAGDDDYLAEQPSFWTEHGVALAFLCQCNRTGRENNEQPFLDAAANKPGFAWLNEGNMTGGLAAVRPLVDLVVTQFHAGIEYSTGPGTLQAPGAAWPEAADLADAAGPQPGDPVFLFPTEPALTDRQLRWRAVEDGADLVICHHPHVLQGFEVYKGKLIAHSLGNFVFDQTYAETFPSIILRGEFTKSGFQTFTFRPVFIDDLVPRPATGRLGREILDRMADYSRAMNTVVTVDPAEMRGEILLDTTKVVWSGENFTVTRPLTAEGGAWVSPPIEREGLGVLSRLLAAAPAGAFQVRVGREILWHGDMEDEGASMWDLNSSSESYDASVYHQGLRSLALKRTSSNSGSVVTDLQGYPPIRSGSDSFSLCGWLRTENAVNAGFSARLFSGRGGTALGTYEVASLAGAHDWTWLWSDFDAPSASAFMNVRAHLDRPTSGEGYAWFDQLRLIQWEDWQDASLPLSFNRPSNLRFLQVRFFQAQDSVRLTWEDVLAQDAASGLPPEGTGTGAELRLLLEPPRPNPFRGGTLIEYHLPRPDQVRLEIFDPSGRRMASLFRGPQPAGLHQVAWKPERIAPGLYFCRLQAGGTIQSSKLILLR